MLSVSRDELDTWHRRTCWVADTRLALSGDLPTGRAEARRQLASWVDAGISHIVDLRDDANDEGFVARLQPHVRYTWLGIEDDGNVKPDEWFDRGVDAAVSTLGRPGAAVMVHCSLGMQRGPSMGFATLLALGWEPLAALDAIVAARPIARIRYANDALAWWHRRIGMPVEEARRLQQEVSMWQIRRRTS